jgi:hypothetical protein
MRAVVVPDLPQTVEVDGASDEQDRYCCAADGQ